MSRKKKQQKKTVILIAALQHDRGVGKNNELLWSIKDDMQHFMEATRGNAVIMGRKTWESIPENFRPLANRKNIVVTRDQNYQAPGAVVVNKFYQALDEASSEEKTYVIGGAEIYRQALSYADMLDLTLIQGHKDADSFFPEYEDYFVEEARSKTFTDPESGVDYSFVSFLKK